MELSETIYDILVWLDVNKGVLGGLAAAATFLQIVGRFLYNLGSAGVEAINRLTDEVKEPLKHAAEAVAQRSQLENTKKIDELVEVLGERDNVSPGAVAEMREILKAEGLPVNGTSK